MKPIDRIVTVTLNTAVDRVIDVPGLELGGHLKGSQRHRYPAGKAINVSRALGRVGRANIATGLVGQVEAREFEQFLRSSKPGHVDAQLLAVRGKTRENLTLIDPDRHVDTHIRTEGFEVTARDLERVHSKLGLLCRPGTVVLFGGSLPQGMRAPDLEELLVRVTDCGAAVALDLDGPLLRAVLEAGHLPRFVGQPAGGSDTAGDAGGGLWLIKPNRAELTEAIASGPVHDGDRLLAAARRLAQRATYVVVTLGAEGALLVGPEGVWRGKVAVGQERVINTVGCGDCMSAGLIDALAAGAGGEQALRRGIACATINATTAGVGEFTSELVGEWERQVQMEFLEGA